MRIFTFYFLLFIFYLPAHAQEIKQVDTTTLQYALRKGKTDLNLRMYYMTTQNEEEFSDYYAWAFGGGLKYETGKYKGFQLGVGGFFIWNLGSSDLGKPDPASGALNRYEIGQFDIENPYNKNDMARLEDLYIKYNYKHSSITYGKMVINTPFINPQDGRMRPSAEQGFWLEMNEIKRMKIHAGWLTGMSPRGTVRWYDVDESIGLYSQGVNLDGTRSNYKGNLNSNGVGLIGAAYKPSPKITVQLWDQFIENIMNTIMLQADGEWPVGTGKLIGGLQYTRQDAVAYGGNEDPRKTYYDPSQKTNVISGRLGYGKPSSKVLLNYTRITADGRYLSPREWGREPLYTFLKRERNEGFGDVNAFSVNVLNDWNSGRLKSEFSYGYYDLPGVANTRLNKYQMPSYHQFLGSFTYDVPGFLTGMRLELLYTYKLEAETVKNPRAIINKVNMHHVNFIVNYRL